MKSLLIIKTVFVILISSGISSCCWFDKCECDEPVITEKNVNINYFDTNPWSFYYNNVILSFQLSQEKIDYGFECNTDQSSTSLVIKNVISQGVSLDYNITAYGANSGNFLWSYQGVSSIPPFGTAVIGQVNTDPVYLDKNVIYIQSANISYF